MVSKSNSLSNRPGVIALMNQGAHHIMKKIKFLGAITMNDREEAEFREEADGFFDGCDRDDMEDWFEGDA